MHPGVYAILWYMPSDEYDNQGFALNLSICRSRMPQVPPTTVSVARSSRMGQREQYSRTRGEGGGTTGTASA